jgi:Cu-Zn family superoxide dismutase
MPFIRHMLLPIALPLALSACSGALEPTGGPVYALVGPAGGALGSVRAWETPGGVTFRLDARGVPLGLHGIHVHAVGRCQGPGFESAGPHWNPNGRRHGFNNPAGPHRGDLQNVTVTATGVLTESVTLAGTRLAEMADADGSALVLHAARDDFTTDPSGNSGARIACAVISPPAGG